MALEVAKHLIGFGANPRKIQLSHLNKNPDRILLWKNNQRNRCNYLFWWTWQS
nr:hypothetical protein [Mycoplasmopsis bovis]